MNALLCGCPGSPFARGEGDVEQCPRAATQEDFLCDPCRDFRCPEVVTEEQNDAAYKRVYPWLAVEIQAVF